MRKTALSREKNMQAGIWSERNQRTGSPRRVDTGQKNGLRAAQAQTPAGASLEYIPPSRDVVQRLIHWLEEPGK